MNYWPGKQEHQIETEFIKRFQVNYYLAYDSFSVSILYPVPFPVPLPPLPFTRAHFTYGTDKERGRRGKVQRMRHDG